MAQLKISVLLPIKNESIHNLNSCFQSLFNQTYRHFEIIIIDDSDKEITINAIDDFNTGCDKLNIPIKVLRNNTSKSVAGALNYGLQFCNCEYIARVDSDDVSYSTRFEEQLKFLEANSSYYIVGAFYRIIDHEDNLKKVIRFPSSNQNIKRFMYLRSTLAHPTLLIRKTFFENVGYYDESLNRAEDYDLWLRAIKINKIKIKNLSIPLLYFRKTDISEKKRRQNTSRDQYHWETNLKIKIKNFNFSYFLFSISGIFLMQIFILIPDKIKRHLYNILN
jgi:glycosyltransferase involved in cell wall biosynthesis